MSSPRRSNWLPLLTAFLIAPAARALTPTAWSEPPPRPRGGESVAAWQGRMLADCGRTFRGHFAAWSHLSLNDAQAVADALCAEGRVLWPYVEVHDPGTYRVVADHVPRAEGRPLIYGLTSRASRNHDAVLQALRHALHPSSAMLLRWVDNPAALREWLAKTHGGRLGGVIYAVIDAEDDFGREEQIRRARRAIDFVERSARAAGDYTLVIDNRVPGLDLRSRLAGPRWISLATHGCPAQFTSL